MTTLELNRDVTAAPRTRRAPLDAIKRCLLDPGPSVERLAEQALLREAVRVVLEGLSPERREVLALSFGLTDRTGVSRGFYTIDEIARVLKVSRERVAAVRATTLLRLRQRKDTVRRLGPFVHLLLEEKRR
jgi:RNA polymerase nonessential primary-like sigma factor